MKQGRGWATILTPLNGIKNRAIWVQPFEKKNVKTFLSNTGYHLVSLVVGAFIITCWIW